METPAGFAAHASGLHVATMMRCGREGCADTTLDAQKQPDGTIVLRCGCTDRVLRR